MPTIEELMNGDKMSRIPNRDAELGRVMRDRTMQNVPANTDGDASRILRERAPSPIEAAAEPAKPQPRPVQPRVDLTRPFEQINGAPSTNPNVGPGKPSAEASAVKGRMNADKIMGMGRNVPIDTPSPIAGVADEAVAPKSLGQKALALGRGAVMNGVVGGVAEGGIEATKFAGNVLRPNAEAITPTNPFAASMASDQAFAGEIVKASQNNPEAPKTPDGPIMSGFKMYKPGIDAVGGAVSSLANDALSAAATFFKPKPAAAAVPPGQPPISSPPPKPQAAAQPAPMTPGVNPNGNWDQINASNRATQPGRNQEQLALLQQERAGATDPASQEALDREIKRAQGMQVQSPARSPVQSPAESPIAQQGMAAPQPLLPQGPTPEEDKQFQQLVAMRDANPVYQRFLQAQQDQGVLGQPQMLIGQDDARNTIQRAPELQGTREEIAAYTALQNKIGQMEEMRQPQYNTSIEGMRTIVNGVNVPRSIFEAAAMSGDSTQLDAFLAKAQQAAVAGADPEARKQGNAIELEGLKGKTEIEKQTIASAATRYTADQNKSAEIYKADKSPQAKDGFQQEEEVVDDGMGGKMTKRVATPESVIRARNAGPKIEKGSQMINDQGVLLLWDGAQWYDPNKAGQE